LRVKYEVFAIIVKVFASELWCICKSNVKYLQVKCGVFASEFWCICESNVKYLHVKCEVFASQMWSICKWILMYLQVKCEVFASEFRCICKSYVKYLICMHKNVEFMCKCQWLAFSSQRFALQDKKLHAYNVEITC